MAHRPATELSSDHRFEDAAKVRACLRCRTTFHSEWAGERVCSRCKGTTAWRSGEPPRFHPVGSRR